MDRGLFFSDTLQSNLSTWRWSSWSSGGVKVQPQTVRGPTGPTGPTPHSRTRPPLASKHINEQISYSWSKTENGSTLPFMVPLHLKVSICTQNRRRRDEQTGGQPAARSYRGLTKPSGGLTRALARHLGHQDLSQPFERDVHPDRVEVRRQPGRRSARWADRAEAPARLRTLRCSAVP